MLANVACRNPVSRVPRSLSGAHVIKMQWIVPLLLFFQPWNIRGCEDLQCRSKRQLLHPPPIVYPYGGNFKLIMGITMPVQLQGRILVYAQNFQFQYPLPDNATFFTNFFEDASSSRRRRQSVASDERMKIYKLLEQDFDRRGIAGESCLKKSICEAAATPVQDEGLIGEILHLLLTPDYGGGNFMDPGYLQAAENGRRNNNCSMIYAACPADHGILDQISRVLTI
ncbi:hypothetical protein KM043_007923 [Ampulex compressa]|nr:hypothetical protein KM043_007923 [Ampulex compressa]